MKRFSIMQRKISLGNKTWYGRISEDGEFRYISLKTTRKSDAVEWLNAMNAGRFLPEAMMERLLPKDKGLEQALKAFLDYVTAQKGELSSTVKAYRYRLKAFKNWCDEKKIQNVRSFNNQRAAEFAIWLSERYEPKSQREMIRCTKQFCKWSADTFDILGYDPFKAVAGPKVVKKFKEFWTREQLDMIIDRAPDREFRLFWSLMAFAGLRHAEACAFGPESVVEGGKLRIMGKGDKEAFLPISDRLKEEIERYGELSSGMFSTQRFRKSERCIKTLCDAVAAAGLKVAGANNHKFRHSCISNWARSNVGFKQLADLARHSDVKITYETYAHLLPSDLAIAVNKKSPEQDSGERIT